MYQRCEQTLNARYTNTGFIELHRRVDTIQLNDAPTTPQHVWHFPPVWKSVKHDIALNRRYYSLICSASGFWFLLTEEMI